jgi:hypothetical protein
LISPDFCNKKYILRWGVFLKRQFFFFFSIFLKDCQWWQNSRGLVDWEWKRPNLNVQPGDSYGHQSGVVGYFSLPQV